MDEPTSVSVTATIRRLLEDETKRPGNDAYEDELGLYMAAGDEKRRVIDDRLKAFADLPKEDDRTVADIGAVATRLGGAQSNVYRLLKRIRTHGPVSGLMPRNKLNARSGVAAGGFGEPVDGWIADAMRSRPDIGISEIAGLLSSKARLLQARDAGGSVALPSLASIRRRVQALRTEGRTGQGLELLGRSLLIDRCPTDIIVKAPPVGGGRPELRRVSVAVVLEVQTGAVLGLGAFIDGNAVLGIAAALRHLKTRTTMLALDGAWFAGPPSRVVWMVSDDLVPFARDVADRAAAIAPPVELVCHVVEDARPGRELYRSLGGRIGPFELLARASAEAEVHSHDIARRPSDEDVFTLSGAQSALRAAAMRRDRRWIDGIPKSRPKRLGAAMAFRDSIGLMFEPVLVGATRLGSLPEQAVD